MMIMVLMMIMTDYDDDFQEDVYFNLCMGSVKMWVTKIQHDDGFNDNYEDHYDDDDDWIADHDDKFNSYNILYFMPIIMLLIWLRCW